MSEAPLISVVVAYHDEPEEFLRECLQSLLDQTFELWEGILVDDASHSEASSTLVDEIGDARFRVIRHDTSLGLGAARNTGIRSAKAPLVALLDADDRLADQFLDLTYHALEDQPAVDWVVVDWQCFGMSDEVWPFPIDDSLNCPAHFLFVGSGVLMRKDVWTSVGGYSEEKALRGGEDWDFWLTAAEQDLQPVHLPQALYQYRIHPEAMTFRSARFDNYKFRQAIHRRHRMAFRSMGMDCPHCPSPRARVAKFLAQGLAVSSHAYLGSGQRLKGIGLAARAFLLQPTNPSFGRHLLSSLLPIGLRSGIHRLRRWRTSKPPSTPTNS
ncbi:MAG TPA: glycosyltransferase [Acidimicrobiia bacterium]|nr:glycosyltransferase [Acidimicrobiia bacterium]